MLNRPLFDRTALWPALGAMLLLVGGCADRPPTQAVSFLSLPVAYSGTLPCADCAGIDYDLTLGVDHVYVLREHYDTPRAIADNVETGRWTLQTADNRLRLTPDDSDDSSDALWRLDGPERITALDADGQPIDAALDFTLTRRAVPVAPPLTDTPWVLVNAPNTPGRIPAHVRFDPVSRRISGFTGCNRLTGHYDRQADRLDFGTLSATRMACPDQADTEQSMLEALGHASRLRILGDYLLLYGDDMGQSPLVVFRAADGTRA